MLPYQGDTASMESLFALAILALSVVFHEVAHGYAALALGDRTALYQGRLTMNPLRHIDPFGSVVLPLLLSFIPGGIILGWAKPVPYNPYNLRWGRGGEALVAAAGPASNFLLALALGLALRFFDQELTPSVSGLIATGLLINVTLAVFNLVPIPPLDGSKILFSWLSWDSPFRQFIEKYGIFLALFFAFAGFELIVPIIRLISLFLAGGI